MYESKRIQVLTAGTAVRCAGDHLIVWRAQGQASSGNKGRIFIGASGVTNRDSSNRYVGHVLASGVAMPEIYNEDLYNVFVNADVAGDQLQLNYQRRPSQI